MKRTAVLLLALTASALGADEGVSFGFEGPRIVGADLRFSLQNWSVGLGAGYQEFDLGRSLSDGSPTAPPSAGSHDTYAAAWVPDAAADLRYTLDLGEAVGWVSAGVHGWGDFGTGPAASGRFPDWAGDLGGVFQAGLTRDRMKADDRGVVTGTSVRAVVETSPAVLSLRSAWYHRASFRAGALLPLWAAPADAPLFAGVLGFGGSVVWTEGEVPVPLLEPTLVRGYHEFFDTRLRTWTTAELRVSLPSLWGDHDLVPVVLAFADGGYGFGYARAPAPAADRSVWLAGAGGGVGMNFFGAVTPTVQFGLPLVGSEADFWWTVAFSLRF